MYFRIYLVELDNCLSYEPLRLYRRTGGCRLFCPSFSEEGIPLLHEGGALKFVNSNVFLRAYLKPKREVRPKEELVKQKALEIVKRLKDGEAAVTSTCHL